MPQYDYKCTDCQKIFEVSKGMNEAPKDLTCLSCGGKEVRRVFSKVRITKSGSGLLNDYGTSGSSCDTCGDGVCSTCSVRR